MMHHNVWTNAAHYPIFPHTYSQYLTAMRNLLYALYLNQTLVVIILSCQLF